MYRRQPYITVILILLLCIGCNLKPDNQVNHQIKGRVVSLEGKPVPNALITISSGQAKSDRNGWFTIPTIQITPQWVRVKHTRFISRTRAAEPNTPVLIRLTPNDGKTVAIHFTGDVMFGRRFYDPNEDGNTSDGLLKPGAGLEEYRTLFRYAQPLLEDADLTVVNMESPITEEPYFNPTGERPAKFHQTKEYVFASAPIAAAALKQAGVDVIGLANNHLYDVLEPGVYDTLKALNQEGFKLGETYFGAGLSEREAWTPAVTSIRGQTVAFLGCTTISGAEHPLNYVASNTQRKGGAAHCDEEQIRKSITSLRRKYTTVVFMVHGGNEYDRTPTENVRRMTRAAQESGATLVINHHPHVVGGFDWNGSSLLAWTMGNFLFDQTVWPTFESYLLAVHLREGRVIQAYTEPLIIDGYLPKGVTGDLADYVARGAAGRNPGPFIVEGGSMEVDVDNRSKYKEVEILIKNSKDSIYHLSPGWSIADFSGVGNIRLGRDILWVGGFEDEITDEQQHRGALWMFTGFDKLLSPRYAYEGKVGLRLQRKGFNYTDVVISPLHRILVQPGSHLSILGSFRSNTNTLSNVQISWYTQTKGQSQAKQVKPLIGKGEKVWTPFRIEVTVPRNTVAIGLYLRLQAPRLGTRTIDFDNIKIIEWEPTKKVSYNPLYSYIQTSGSGKVTLRKHYLPGGESFTNPSQLTKVSDLKQQ
jgi:poly-gamma-glutamate synthesis protein (capsule biosynthesis protein)